MATLTTKQEDIKLLSYHVERWLVPAEFAHPSCALLPSVPNSLDLGGGLIFSCLMLPF